MTKINFVVYFGIVPFLLGLALAPYVGHAKVYESWQDAAAGYAEERCKDTCISNNEEDIVFPIPPVEVPTTTPLQVKSQAEVKLEIQEDLNEALNEKIQLLEQLIKLYTQILALQTAAQNER